MVHVHVSLTVRNQADVDRVRELLAEHARSSRGEPGCVRFELSQSRTDSHQFFLVEAWESQESLDIHRTAEAFTTIYGPRVLPLVDRAAHVVEPVE